MEHTYYDEGNKLIENFINKCLNVILSCVEQSPNKKLHFNSTEYIFAKENKEGTRVPYIALRDEEIELYSDEGWINPQDIGNWADNCIDIINSVKSGNGSRYGYKNKNFELKR